MSADIHPTTNLKLIDLKRKENEIRGAFSVLGTMGEYMPLDFRLPIQTQGNPFLSIDKSNVNLNDLITNLSVQIGLPRGGSNEYGLMFDKPNPNTFLTSEALATLKDGFILIFTASPQNYAKKMLYKLENIDLFAGPSQSAAPVWQTTLNNLFNLAQDPTFAKEFHHLNGIQKIIGIIENGSFDGNAPALCRLFCIFMELMRHPNLVDWADMPYGFIEKVAEYVNGRAKFESNESLRLSLSILLTILDKGGALEAAVKACVKFESLIRHLEKKEERVLLCVLTLMNLLYNKVEDAEERSAILKLLHDKPFRSAIEKVIQFELKRPDDQIKQQLVLIQEICFTQLKTLAMTRPKCAELEHVIEMKEWSFNSPRSSAVIPEGSREFDRLSNCSTRGMVQTAKTKFADLVNLTPPGSLAIDTIIDYAKRFQRRLTDIQFESNLQGEAWPSIMARLVTYLVNILSIVPEKAEDQPEIPLRPWQIMFNSERPFCDLFAVAFELFSRTWREMHADGEDEKKVLRVVRHQLALGIDENPPTLKDLDEILQKKFSYFHMLKVWEKEREEKEEVELKSSTGQELIRHLRPSMEELVKTKKKNVLKRGYTFVNVRKGKSANDKKDYIHFVLDDSGRCFWFTEALNSNPVYPKLDIKTRRKMSVSDIKRIVTGLEYSETVVQQIGMKLSKKSSSKLALKQGFSIELRDNPDLITLTTEDENVLQNWIEGLNVLLGTEGVDENEVNRFLDMEVRTRLLELKTPQVYLPHPFPNSLEISIGFHYNTNLKAPIAYNLES